MRHTLYIIKRLDWRIALVIVSLFAILWLQAPRLADEFRVDEDFRTFYWMNKFEDAELFSNDQLGSHRYTNIRLPEGDLPLYFYSLGYGLLFYAASFFVTPVCFSKLLPFFLMPITVWYLFEYGQSVHDRGIGTVLAAGFVLLNLVSSTSLSVITGLQRSFSCPLMIALVYYLHRQNYVAAAVVVLMSALIYPPVFLLAVVTWGLFALKLKWPLQLRLSSVTERGLGPLLIAFSLSVLILSPILLPRSMEVFTSDKTVGVGGQPAGVTPDPYKHLWDNPQYRAGGRKPLFYSFPFIGRGGLVNKGPDALHLLILFSISCLICLVRGRRARDLPYVIWYMLWAGLIVFAAAWAAIWLTDSFLLYMPSRYTRVGLFLFLLMFVFLNIRGAIQDAVVLIQRNRRRLTWLMVGIELLALALILLYPSDRTLFMGVNMKWLLAPASFIFGVLGVMIVSKPLPSNSDVPRPRQMSLSRPLLGVVIVICLGSWAAYAPIISDSSFLNPLQAERELLRFLETLPKDVLLAGTPCVLDNVPLLAKRRILFSCEQISKDADLTRRALSAYYADDRREIVDFCQTYHVDYLVVDLGAYSEEYLAAGKIFFEPYNQELLPHIAARDTFALAQVSEDVKIFQSGNLFVVPCDSSLAKVN